MKNNLLQIFAASALIVLLVLLSDPFMYLMPETASMFILLGITVLVCIFAGFVMRENAGDEREVTHRMYAGRAAYLSGIGILTIALIVQGLSHSIDPWILIALGAMVLVKLGARFYSDCYY